MFLLKGVLKVCSKFPGENLCQSAISIKLQNKFIEITLGHWCSPGNLLHIFRALFSKNNSGGMLLQRHLCKVVVTTVWLYEGRISKQRLWSCFENKFNKELSSVNHVQITKHEIEINLNLIN